MASNPTYPASTLRANVAKRIADSDSTNIVDVYDNSGGSVAVKIESLSIATDNSADRIAKFYLHDGSVSQLIGSVNVPDLSGTNGTTDPRVNVLATLGVASSDGVLCIWVPPACKLQASLDSALASGKYLYVTGRAIPYT